MLQENIEKFCCKVGIVLRHQGEVCIRLVSGNPLHGSMPAQILENKKNNLWDFGHSDRPLIHGEDIEEIVLWDRAYTRKYSDEFPDGVITGRSGTSRSARPAIY